MKLILGLLFAMIGGVALALFLREDTGYALLGFGHWSVEMSLTLLGLTWLLSAWLLHLSLNSLRGLARTPRRLLNWQRQRARERSSSALTKGLLAQAEGDWKTAERSLLSNARRGQEGVVNYLAAARAAQQQGASERAQRYLALAHHHAPADDLALGLTEAELQLENGQLEQALASLMRLRRQDPKNHHMLSLLASLYEKLEDWQSLRGLLPELRRRRVFTAAQLTGLEQRACLGQLEKLDSKADELELMNLWRLLPKELQKDHTIIASYSRQLMLRGQDDQAEPILRQALRREFDPQLMDLYGRLKSQGRRRQLNEVENWLKVEPDNTHLLLAAGRLAMAEQLWGKAQSVLEKAVTLRAEPEAYAMLAELLEHHGDHQGAERLYREGLKRAVGDLPGPSGAA